VKKILALLVVVMDRRAWKDLELLVGTEVLALSAVVEILRSMVVIELLWYWGQ